MDKITFIAFPCCPYAFGKFLSTFNINNVSQVVDVCPDMQLYTSNLEMWKSRNDSFLSERTYTGDLLQFMDSAKPMVRMHNIVTTLNVQELY